MKFVPSINFSLSPRLVFMRDDALARVGVDGPDYIIDRVDDNVNENIYRLRWILVGTTATYMCMY